MPQPFTPFETIESAQDFLRVLGETITEARQELAADLEREMQLPPSRRTRALQIAAYNLDKLEKQFVRSRRILNDLRSLRRLLFEERTFHHVKALGGPPASPQQLDSVPPLFNLIPAPRPISVPSGPTRALQQAPGIPA